MNTVGYVKELYPEIDLVYLIDRPNAPYGIKSEKELIRLAERNIDELTDRGAERVLIACCTASTVYTKISKRHRELSIPIISPVADAARRATKTGSIGVIATRRTVASHAFGRAMPEMRVSELAVQELVAMIDGGVNDSTVGEGEILTLKGILSPLFGKNIDTLVLGCTHFPSLISTFHTILAPLGVKSIIDSARIGADELARVTCRSRSA